MYSISCLGGTSPLGAPLMSSTTELFEQWQRAERRVLALRALADSSAIGDAPRHKLDKALDRTRSACRAAQVKFAASMAGVPSGHMAADVESNEDHISSERRSA